jgi:LysM repeat protein
MMNRWVLVYCFLFCFSGHTLLAQDSVPEVQIYQVQPGDQFLDIIKRFITCRAELLALNPDLNRSQTQGQSLLNPGQSLIVPKNSDKTTAKERASYFVEHKVKRKETLFGIAQTYGLSVLDVQAYNTQVTPETLDKGDRLKIFTACKAPSQQQVELLRQKLSDQLISWHLVSAKETLWSLAHQYNMSLQELQELNPDMSQTLSVGQSIKVRGNASDTPLIGNIDYDYYAVQPKEGFFRLRQKFGLTREEIIDLNPNASEGLKLGMVLRLPKQVLAFLEPNQEAIVDLRDFIQDSSAQKITLMLPLQLEGFVPDSLDLNQQYMQSNRLLRIALDFYSGVLMAKDYAKAYGLPVSIDVLDTQAKKSVVDSLLNIYDFSQTDLVLGPLLPANVLSVAQHLSDQNIPVIAPLSRPNGRVPNNLVQTIPDPEPMRRALMDYIKRNKQKRKMLFVGDAQEPGMTAMRREWPGVKVLLPREQGYIDPDDILPHLSDSLENWVVLESKKPVIISNVIGVLNGMAYYHQKNEENDTIKKTYDVRLFTTSKNEAFEFDDISNIHLSHLEFSFPSLSSPLSLDETPNAFVQAYLERFGTTPNKYATRGYDLTLDLILRQASNKGPLNEALIMAEATQYTENKFRYESGVNGGFDNKAFYLLKYTQDMRLEEMINSLGARN